METIMTMLVIISSAILAANIAVASTMTANEMRQEFWTEQNTVGKIAANTFYALAWAIKIAAAVCK